jgi:hypothetical protein
MTIIAAAIRFPAKPDEFKPDVKDLILFIPAPARHHNVLHSFWYQVPEARADGRTHESYMGEVQGFLTNEGVFLNRLDALVHARACGQMKPRQPGDYNGDELFSEDLW